MPVASHARRAWLLGALLLGVSCGSLSDAGVSYPTPERGMVVAEHPEAVRAGLSILESGGNAADAAVATALALAVVYPKAGNLGGGGFALWVDHEGAASGLDFRETAPGGMGPEDFLDAEGEVVPSRSRRGPLASGVPGSPAGLYALWDEHGSGLLTFAEVCAPAVRLAEDGFAVDPWLASDLRRKSYRELLEASAGSRALFYPDGQPLQEGTLLRQPQLARTLRQLGRHGPVAFYEGAVAEAIVSELARTPLPDGSQRGVPSRIITGSAIQLEDLANYSVKRREPLRGWFRGMEVVTMPPPSSGGVALLQTLFMIDGLPTARRTDTTSGLDEETCHRWIEVLRRAFADRAVHLGDPDHVDVPVEELLSSEWSSRRRVSIGERADPNVAAYARTPVETGSDTTHLSVLDDEGNAVSLTTTINGAFGSGVLVTGAGFLMNNEIDDFAVAAGAPNMYGLVGDAANAVAPNKRPLSSMTPTVVRDGGRFNHMVVGSPGGPRIITAVIQVLLRTLIFGEDIESAVTAPRLHQQWRPVHTRLEAGFDEDLREALEARGHELSFEPNARFGSVQAIQVEMGGMPRGIGDPRRGGTAGVEGGEPAPPALPGRR